MKLQTLMIVAVVLLIAYISHARDDYRDLNLATFYALNKARADPQYN